MPGKVNPVMCESVIQVAAQVIGNDAAVTLGGLYGNFELNVMMPLIARNLLESVEILANVSRVFKEKCVEEIKANAERCEAAIEQSLSLCTSFAPVIGYDQAAALAKEAFQTGKTIREVARSKRILSDEQIDRILDPRKMLKPGEIQKGVPMG
jgi:fumarate hydratase class II